MMLSQLSLFFTLEGIFGTAIAIKTSLWEAMQQSVKPAEIEQQWIGMNPTMLTARRSVLVQLWHTQPLKASRPCATFLQMAPSSVGRQVLIISIKTNSNCLELVLV